MTQDRSPPPLSPDSDWIPAGRLRWIVALALIGLVVVTTAYAVATTTPY